MLMHQKVDAKQAEGLGPIAISEALGISIEDTLMWLRVAKVQRRKKAAKAKRDEKRFSKIAYAGSHRQHDWWFITPEDRKTKSQKAYELYIRGDDIEDIVRKLGVCRRTATNYISTERNRRAESKRKVLVPYAGAN